MMTCWCCGPRGVMECSHQVSSKEKRFSLATHISVSRNGRAKTKSIQFGQNHPYLFEHDSVNDFLNGLTGLNARSGPGQTHY